MKLLTNPLVMPIVFFAAAFLFIIGLLVMRRLRKQLTAADQSPRTSVDAPDFQLTAYHGVIQRLKERELEVQKLRREAADKAAASQNLSDAVLSNLTSGVVLFNNAGILRQANQAAKGILGYASPFGLHARDLFRGVTAVRKETGDPSDDTLPQAVETAARNGASYRRLEADYQTPAGQNRVLGITLSPVRAAAGEPLGTACLVTDLTEVTGMARQMRTREQLASLGEMSAGIAHEFKNSLATISGYAQMLRADNDPPTVRDFAARIVDETASLTRIVTDFLAFARPQELVSQPIDLHQTLEDCARECGVDLDTSAVPYGFSISGDPTALRQALSNLLRNSAEACRDQAPVKVVASLDSEGSATRLTLRDNGRGIPPDLMSRIFVPFFTTKSAGTGLGLALVHRIVTQHGGSIAVASDAAGTAFTLSFPAEKLAPAPLPAGIKS